MIVLRLIERLGRLDLGHDRSRPVHLLTRLRTDCGLPLLLVVREHHRPILISDVPTLAVELRRIVLVPENVEKLFV